MTGRCHSQTSSPNCAPRLFRPGHVKTLCLPLMMATTGVENSTARDRGTASPVDGSSAGVYALPAAPFFESVSRYGACKPNALGSERKSLHYPLNEYCGLCEKLIACPFMLFLGYLGFSRVVYRGRPDISIEGMGIGIGSRVSLYVNDQLRRYGEHRRTFYQRVVHQKLDAVCVPAKSQRCSHSKDPR